MRIAECGVNGNRKIGVQIRCRELCTASGALLLKAERSRDIKREIFTPAEFLRRAQHRSGTGTVIKPLIDDAVPEQAVFIRTECDSVTAGDLVLQFLRRGIAGIDTEAAPFRDCLIAACQMRRQNGDHTEQMRLSPDHHRLPEQQSAVNAADRPNAEKAVFGDIGHQKADLINMRTEQQIRFVFVIAELRGNIALVNGGILRKLRQIRGEAFCLCLFSAGDIVCECQPRNTFADSIQHMGTLLLLFIYSLLYQIGAENARCSFCFGIFRQNRNPRRARSQQIVCTVSRCGRLSAPEGKVYRVSHPSVPFPAVCRIATKLRLTY